MDPSPDPPAIGIDQFRFRPALNLKAAPRSEHIESSNNQTVHNFSSRFSKNIVGEARAAGT